MAVPRRVSSLWIAALLTGGAVLALALLVQTIVTYSYVSSNLIQQQARRVSDERVRNAERAARLSRPQSAQAFQTILDDIRTDSPEQVAALTLVATDGSTVATSGQVGATLGADERKQLIANRNAPLVHRSLDGREVLVGIFPCRCSLPRPATEPGGTGRTLLEVALFRDSLSAPFARLRRNAAVSASAALALLLSVALIGARFRPYVRGKQLEGQAQLARQVQRDLLPDPAAWPSGLDVGAVCRPAWQVGGDFYDIVALPGGRVSFALGDVSGHGISAALLMGLIHGAMSSPPWGLSDEDPGRAAERLNDLLLTKSSGDRFASLFWCLYDPAARKVRYLNAGHLPALRVRRQANGHMSMDRLADGGPVLGVLRETAYATVSIDAGPGDLVVVFSDGITEASNSSGEPFGEDRLIALIATEHHRPSPEICEAILAAVGAFSGKAPRQDDQTLLVVRLWDADHATGRSRSPAPA
jgi:serine phosphatase RsbU (regulator of sigma subunit)